MSEPFDTASAYLDRPGFTRWKDNPEEPRDWNGVASFLGLPKDDNSNASAGMEAVRNAVRDAII